MAVMARRQLKVSSRARVRRPPSFSASLAELLALLGLWRSRPESRSNSTFVLIKSDTIYIHRIHLSDDTTYTMKKRGAVSPFNLRAPNKMEGRWPK